MENDEAEVARREAADVVENKGGDIMANDDEVYNRAKARAEAKIGFLIHLGVYIGVNAMLVIINLLTSSEHLWFVWPLVGWGVGVFIHGLVVVSASSKVKARMIEKEMRREVESKSESE